MHGARNMRASYHTPIVWSRIRRKTRRNAIGRAGRALTSRAEST